MREGMKGEGGNEGGNERRMIGCIIIYCTYKWQKGNIKRKLKDSSSWNGMYSNSQNIISHSCKTSRECTK